MKRVFRWMKGFLLILVLGAAVGFGGYRIYQGNFGGAVSVYQIDSNISTEENWNISDSMDGVVKNSGTQSVTLSDTQTVGETMVKLGDTVKKGDVLIQYDEEALADEIELEKRESLKQEDYTMKNTARNLVLYGASRDR